MTEPEFTEQHPITIVVDLDATLAYYEHFDPVIGKRLRYTADAIHIVRKKFPDVKFVTQTCRTNGFWGAKKQLEQRSAVERWLKENDLNFMEQATDTGKAIGYMYLDDRTISVMPNKGNAKELARAIEFRLLHGFGPQYRGLKLASIHWDSYNSLFLLSFDVPPAVVKIARNYYISGFVDGYDLENIATVPIAERFLVSRNLIPTDVTKCNRFNYTSAFVHGNTHGLEDRGEKYSWL